MSFEWRGQQHSDLAPMGPARVAAAATPHGGSTAHNATQHARAGRGTQTCRHTAARSTQCSRTKQSNVPQQRRRKPHHPPQAPAPAQHPTRKQGPDTPHGHFTHAQPPPPANKARAQTSKAGPGGSDSSPPMGRRPYPSASEITRTRPRRGERPCPGSRGPHVPWPPRLTEAT